MIPAVALCIYKYADCVIIKALSVFGTSACMEELIDYSFLAGLILLYDWKVGCFKG